MPGFRNCQGVLKCVYTWKTKFVLRVFLTESGNRQRGYCQGLAAAAIESREAVTFDYGALEV